MFTRAPSGWRLWLLLTTGVVLLAVTVLYAYGTREIGLGILLRATGRSSLLLFLCAFTASSIRMLRRSPSTAWLLRNRRYFGLAFAASHTIHGIAIFAFAHATGTRFEPLTLAIGGLGYAFVAALTATSFDRTAAWLGARAWKQLHTIGSYYLWFVFLATSAPKAAEPAAALSSALLVTALGLRIAAARRVRNRSRDE